MQVEARPSDAATASISAASSSDAKALQGNAENPCLRQEILNATTIRDLLIGVEDTSWREGGLCSDK